MTHVLASIDLAYWQQTAIKLIVVTLLVPTTALIFGIAARAPRRPALAACCSCWPTGPSSCRRKT
jgi:hypothetical protein